MIYYIVKTTNDSILCHDGEAGCEYMNEHGEYEVWRDPAYHEYVSAYGNHFNEKLSEYASKKLRNADNTDHYWSKEEVMTALESMGKRVPVWMTDCDMHYVANMEYSEHFGLTDSPAKTEADVLKLACEEAWSPNTYEGEFFLCYITEIMTKGEWVDFKSMMM